VLLIKYWSSYTADVMGEACSTEIQSVIRKAEWRENHIKDLEVDGRILKWILNKQGVRLWLVTGGGLL
jgi:hypothetical protein